MDKAKQDILDKLAKRMAKGIPSSYMEEREKAESLKFKRRFKYYMWKWLAAFSWIAIIVLGLSDGPYFPFLNIGGVILSTIMLCWATMGMISNED